MNIKKIINNPFNVKVKRFIGRKVYFGNSEEECKDSALSKKRVYILDKINPKNPKPFQIRSESNSDIIMEVSFILPV